MHSPQYSSQEYSPQLTILIDRHKFDLIQVKWLTQTVNVLDRLLATAIGYLEVYCRRIIVLLLVFQH